MTLLLNMMEIVTKVEYLSEDKIKDCLNDNRIEKWMYILHDKDVNEDGSLKDKHWHIYINFGKKRIRVDTISNLFGVEVQYINKVGKGYNGAFQWLGGLLYITHKNAEGKYQYDDSEVKSNFDFILEREELLLASTSRFSIKRLISDIESGKVKRFNFTQYISIDNYVKYKKKIDLAFDYVEARENQVDREMQVVYIQGKSGSGKTTYGKILASKKNYSCFVSGSSNDPLDGYLGEEAIIFDDLRPSDWKVSDLIKILDNNTSSLGKSRYKNKKLLSKLVIITSILPIDEFFSNMIESGSEEFHQLPRRCKTLLDMDRDEIRIYSYNLGSKKYDFYKSIDNPISDIYNVSNDGGTQDVFAEARDLFE